MKGRHRLIDEGNLYVRRLLPNCGNNNTRTGLSGRRTVEKPKGSHNGGERGVVGLGYQLPLGALYSSGGGHRVVVVNGT